MKPLHNPDPSNHQIYQKPLSSVPGQSSPVNRPRSILPGQSPVIPRPPSHLSHIPSFPHPIFLPIHFFAHDLFTTHLFTLLLLPFHFAAAPTLRENRILQVLINENFFNQAPIFSLLRTYIFVISL
jgi:hypothetical protein